MMQREKPVYKKVRTAGDTMNKGGRPKVAVKLNKIISVKCTSLQKKTIQAKAKKSGFTVSEFLRKLGLDEKIDRTEKALPGNIQELFAAFRHTGSNLNQIAWRLNMEEPMTSFLREQLLYHVSELDKIEESIKAFFQ